MYIAMASVKTYNVFFFASNFIKNNTIFIAYIYNQAKLNPF